MNSAAAGPPSDSGAGARVDLEGAPRVDLRQHDWIFVPPEFFPPRLFSLVKSALDRVETELREALPLSAAAAWDWIRRQSRTEHAADAFRDLRAHIVLVPWLAARSAAQPPDFAFEAELIYSTINGYYYCRLLDDAMDGHDSAAIRLAPLVGFFHVNFQSPYALWFEPDHPFWAAFRHHWFGMADAASAGADCAEISEERFIRVASRKIAGIEAPLAAACFYRLGVSRVLPWSEMFQAFACFNEMQDAMFDWQQDLALAEPTYLLSEAARRRQPSESSAAWLVREGLAWADRAASGWLREAQARAVSLGSPGLCAFLRFREEQAREYWRRFEPHLAQLRTLAAALEPDGR